MTILKGTNITLGYGSGPIVREVDIEIPEQSITIIVGPNGCGKSTLLRGLAGLLSPSAGQISLAGMRLDSMSVRARARRLAFLPQSPIVPDGITVEELVSRGRNPHRKFLRGWTAQDERAVKGAMSETGVDGLGSRVLNELSGGQRQRAWLALVLAQQTELVLLDEPTTYLDIAHQIHVLDICRSLHETHRRTVVAVLHDLNLACRYATNIIVMNEGRVLAEGKPSEVISSRLLEDVFGIECSITSEPISGKLHIIPHRRVGPI
ncbi:ABC transporter ATP-binding protein (plasmid) [Rhizobium sp. CB3060]|uniref:ABC transporter ATP-binding protein n=1 Tax=Rhizobium sp. CB3060 TaxID=3138255 RepID=UPI0021A3020B|nr:ABC transporter ATP-binding protein [Rhizobium tropici]UWU26197.1 ABC transporter ATP-binding protein [Rhizobium tropici]